MNHNTKYNPQEIAETLNKLMNNTTKITSQDIVNNPHLVLDEMEKFFKSQERLNDREDTELFMFFAELISNTIDPDFKVPNFYLVSKEFLDTIKTSKGTSHFSIFHNKDIILMDFIPTEDRIDDTLMKQLTFNLHIYQQLIKKGPKKTNIDDAILFAEITLLFFKSFKPMAK